MSNACIFVAGWAIGCGTGVVAIIILAAFSLPDLKPITLLEPPSHD